MTPWVLHDLWRTFVKRLNDLDVQPMSSRHRCKIYAFDNLQFFGRKGCIVKKCKIGCKSHVYKLLKIVVTIWAVANIAVGGTHG